MATPFAMRAAWLLALAALEAQAQISVMAPEWLVRTYRTTTGTIEGSTATFGAPFYGDRVLGKLVYGESELGKSHCTPDDYKVPPPETTKRMGSDYKEVRLINIVMVRRGKCSFTTKVRIAYEKGAHAVLIVDKEDSELTAKDMRNIIVADDGTGDNIRIPSIMISKEDGNTLIEATKRSQVIVELAWNLPTNKVVKTDLWMSSGSSLSMKFLKDFAPKRRTLNEVMAFQPHYAVFSMSAADSSEYGSLCWDNSGQYCAEDPDGSGPITGRDVLNEDVRQLCIHEMYKKSRSSTMVPADEKVEYAEEYWSYIEKFVDRCHMDSSRASRKFGKECSEKVMQEVGIDSSKIELCVATSGEAKLKNEWEHTAWSPRALRINGWRYSGVLDADLVIRAICSGFVHQPMECQTLIKPRDPTVPYVPQQEGVSFGTLVGWLFGTLVAAFGCLLLYKRYLKKEMRATLREEVMLEVQQQMGEYSRLQGK
eukprot:CAMPEP_0197887670 /NCGR_PEP_ID=MMETSP1439-20131203/19544_1 /TAXON_ID=66791 /ORGANISM="Gonyaulax spinifera, Strain CCMP409" /LENGTH=481 /DNA_ID=CAMNT_0043507521 /DNA_START=25 /DNA_END=1470 /DNA_ORIENTATION=-